MKHSSSDLFLNLGTLLSTQYGLNNNTTQKQSFTKSLQDIKMQYLGRQLAQFH